MKEIKPRSKAQERLLESIEQNIYTFATGYAGTGKSLLTIYSALKMLKAKDSKIGHITIIRPFVKNKLENDIGSLPGTKDEKMAPLGECVIDNLKQIVNGSELDILVKAEKPAIEFTPLSLLRGRSFDREFVIVEEAQNLRRDGVYSVMSRIGMDSKCVFCGDLMQADISMDDCDLEVATRILENPPLKGVGIVKLYDQKDIQRNRLLFELMRRFGKLMPDRDTEDPFEVI